MIKYTEKFVSIQGEGVYVGYPSYFIRLWGCNLRCPKFGKGAPSEYPVVEHLKDFPDLGGCDSAYSWHPNYRHFIKTDTVDTIACCNKNIRHVVITGGEPMLNQPKLAKLIRALFKHREGCIVTIETNTSIPLTEEMRELAGYTYETNRVLFSCSPKMPSSGEQYDSKVVNDYLGFHSVLKLVYQPNSHHEIDLFLKTVNTRCKVYIMAEGNEHNSATALEAVNYAIERGLLYSPRLQSMFATSIGT